MRTLNIPLEDKDYDELLLAKGNNKSWKQFILEKCLNKSKEKTDDVPNASDLVSSDIW